MMVSKVSLLKKHASVNATDYFQKSFGKCLILSVMTSVIILSLSGLESAASFFSSALFGTLNWIALAMIIIGFTSKKAHYFLGGVALKILSLGCFFLLVLPAFISNITTLLLGFSFFLAMIFLEALGYLMISYFESTKPHRPMPEFKFTNSRNTEDA